MSYCVKHAENFHTQTCRRCDDESAIAAKDAEIAALRQEIATGRGQYHRDYAAECDALLAAKDKVIADLRERCGRLAALERARREREDVLKSQPDDWQVLAELAQIQVKAKLAVDAHLAQIQVKAKLAVDAHNDLAPAAGEAPQEKNDE